MKPLRQALDSQRINQFGRDGFLLCENFSTLAECDLLVAELTPLLEKQQEQSKSKLGGLRNLLQNNQRVANFSKSDSVLSILTELCNVKMFPVRAVFFDKTPKTNWLVPWHQDLAIALTEKHETPGFTGWSIKDGVWHAHPPQEILENMLTLRLHLDDCVSANGALKVIPESHIRGKIGPDQILRCAENHQPVICEAAKGDALLMRPLLLHASSPAENPSHRRILHIEFASQQLPNGLRWLEN